MADWKVNKPFIVPAIVISILFLLHSAVCSADKAGEWIQASGKRSWAFPEDHGSHPEYRTEWWYFTGNLSDKGGDRYGYQLTFFRQGIRSSAPDPDNPWSVRDLYMGHFALTDVSRERHRFAERTSRTGPGLAGAGEDSLKVWILDWSAFMKDGTVFLEARDKGMEIRLELNPEKPPVLHGNNGLSIKGPGKGQASWYFSFTDLDTRGFLKTAESGSPVEVEGKSWFDHEFGSNQLAPDQEGWDWFSLHISDGRDLMIYLLRRGDGSVEPSSSGTIVEDDGTARHIELSDIYIEVVDTWKSGATGGVYPGRWRISSSQAGIDLEIYPLLKDQELVTEASTGVIYWEGAVEGRGTSMGLDVECEGYVELTGYAGSMGDVF